MSLKVPYASTLKGLDLLVAAWLEGATLRLYSNNHTPADADTVGDYTECTFPGYAAISLTGWSGAALNGSNKAETVLGPQTFTGGSIVTPEDIYGIFVTDVDGDLIDAEINPAGVVSMSLAGQTYSYTPKFTLKSEF